jgi:ABC-type transport system involved in cytochrome c biogenesis permease component
MEIHLQPWVILENHVLMVVILLAQIQQLLNYFREETRDGTLDMTYAC